MMLGAQVPPEAQRRRGKKQELQRLDEDAVRGQKLDTTTTRATAVGSSMAGGDIRASPAFQIFPSWDIMRGIWEAEVCVSAKHMESCFLSSFIFLWPEQ